MRSSLSRTLAAIALLVTAPAGLVRAQGTIAPPGQATTYRYTDAQGIGTITLTNAGNDPATGGQQILVTIAQNGIPYVGSGLTYPIPGATPPFTNLITFAVQAPGGQAFFFQGKIGLGVEFQGNGTYHPLTDPTQALAWGLLFVPGTTPPPTPTPIPIPTPTPGPSPLSLTIDRGCDSVYPLEGLIITHFGSTTATALTVTERLPDGTPNVLISRYPASAGQTYSISRFLNRQAGPRTVILTDAAGNQLTCGFTVGG